MTQRFNPVIQSTSLSKVVSQPSNSEFMWLGGGGGGGEKFLKKRGGVIIFNESGGGSELTCLFWQDGLY